MGPAPTLATEGQLQVWSEGAKPTFTLQDLSGRDLGLESARGHVVVVHFFATWCEPCRDELPALQRFVDRAGPVRVIAISVAEVDDRVRRFVEKYPLTLPIALDRDRAVTRAWDVSTLPTTFILDTDLKPKLFAESDLAWDSLDAQSILRSLTLSDASPRTTTRHASIVPQEDKK
jgi:thiol-disulfide isomerase/thioredoxin